MTPTMTAEEKAAGAASYAAWLDRHPLALAMHTCDDLAALRRRHETAMLRPTRPFQETTDAHPR